MRTESPTETNTVKNRISHLASIIRTVTLDTPVSSSVLEQHA